MGIYRGSTAVTGVHRGSTEVAKAYRGSALVWSGGAPPPTFNGRKNDFGGISAGTPVTPANSASGGDAFDSIETSNGTVIARTGGVGVQLGGGGAYAYPEWVVPASDEGRFRFYFTTLPSLTAIMRVVNIRNGTSIRAQCRQDNTNARMTLTAPDGNYIAQTNSALATNTRHRVEIAALSGAVADWSMAVYVGESTSALAVTRFSGTDPGTFDRVGIGYIGGGSINAAEVLLDHYAWSPDGATEIGPET